MDETTRKTINDLYAILQVGLEKAKTRSEQVIPPLLFKKEKQKIVITNNDLTPFLGILNRTEKDFLAFLLSKTGTYGNFTPGIGITLRGDIPAETISRVTQEFIKSVTCDICNSIETSITSGVKRCLACA